MKEKKHFLDDPHQNLPLLPFSPPHTSAADGPTVELPRRRRGRPPGSKNKSKPPPSSSSALSISPSPSSSSPNPIPISIHPPMRTLLLQVDPETNLVDSITRFCHNKSISLSLLSASGTLSHFTLRHPSSPPSTLTFRGRFDILSLSATIVSEPNPKNTNSAAATSSFCLPNGFAVTVSGPQGQVVGGAVGGALITAGPVFVVAASFDKPSYHRLPEMDEDEVEGEVAGGGGVGGGFGCNIGGGGGGGGSDVVWAPMAARPSY